MARGKRRDSKPGEGHYEDGWIIDYGHVLRRPQPFDDVELDPETLEQIAAVVAAMTAELNEEIARLAAEERPQLNVLPGNKTLGDRGRISDDGSQELDRVAGRGWKAYHGGDCEEPDEVLVFCPDCAEREFGQS